MDFTTRATAPRGAVVLAYLVITIVMTWPLSANLGTTIASDLGDPVFNCWVLSWTAGQVLAALHGHLGALASYWNGNIFHPARLTLAYSEHLTPEMIQILPVYAATGNIVLGYNLLFLSTFALSGVAMYAFVRDITGRPAAAFLAGLAFAFAPYRLEQLSHVQVLSSFWMPLGLLGVRRYVITGRRRALAGATTAIVLQGLSCGYDLLFFTPFAVAYAVYEMASHGRLREARVWRDMAVAVLAGAVVIAPFVTPYLVLQRAGDLGTRTVQETMMFSADTRSFATAPAQSTFWGGRLTAFPKNEAAAFPGLTILAFAMTGAIWGGWRSAQAVRSARMPRATWWRRAIAAVLIVGAVATGSVLVALLVQGRVVVGAFHHVTMIQGMGPYVARLAIIALAALVLLPGMRAFVAGVPGSVVGFAVVAVVTAAWLALGPRVQAGGHTIGTGPYFWLFAHVPGFDGLRVPARFLMIVALFLAVLAGVGAAAIVGRWPRVGVVALAAGSVAILAEAWMAPMPIGVRIAASGLDATAEHLAVGKAISPIYTLVRKMPEPVVLIEFPFGEPAYDILASFYAGYHRRPIVNGYSGFFPPRYAELAADLGRNPADRDPAAAARALVATGATHAIVHEDAYPPGRGALVSAWLRSTGAHLIVSSGSDKLFVLR